MRDDDFLALNQAMEEAGEQPYANARNTTAGTLKQKNTREVAKRTLQFTGYWMEELDATPVQGRERSHYENVQRLKKLGFPIGRDVRLCTSIDEVMSYIHEWDEQRDSLPFQIDGVVIKVNCPARSRGTWFRRPFTPLGPLRTNSKRSRRRPFSRISHCRLVALVWSHRLPNWSRPSLLARRSHEQPCTMRTTLRGWTFGSVTP